MTSPRRTHKLAKLASRAVLALSLPLAASIPLGFAADVHWLLELTTSLRAPITACLLLLIAIETICWRRWPLLITISSCAAIGVASIATLYVEPTDGRAAASQGVPLRIVFANRGGQVQGLEGDAAGDADLLFLAEVPVEALVPRASRGVESGGIGLSSYPGHRLAFYDIERGAKGIAVLSRAPVDSVEPCLLTGGAAAVEVRLRVGERPWRILALHLQSPKTPEFLRQRNTNLAWAAEWARNAQDEGASVCVVGDLNTSPFSPAFGRLVDAGELKDSMAGYGHQASWPSLASFSATAWWTNLVGHDLWPPILGVAIDHAMHSPDVVCTRRSLGMSSGSDHLPLLVELRPRAHPAPVR